MLSKGIVLVYVHFRIVFSFQHEKPVPQTLWPEPCKADQRVINDCNWCWCVDARWSCKARVCREVDMFGHFNDAIREHIVGMEGHGAWRSNGSACSPREHYQRRGLLCVCDDDGGWPSAVCRDVFRLPHQVEPTGHARPSALHRCVAQRLYLYGCNVCVCPASGRVDPAACTNQSCPPGDPALQAAPAPAPAGDDDDLEIPEVYAECELHRKYIIGCRKCVCLKNNRLLCDNCEREDEVARGGGAGGAGGGDYCAREGAERLFSIDCNICTCDTSGLMYCTTKRCLQDYHKPAVELSKSVDLTLRSVEPPIDALACTPGTKYRQDCNTCFCTEGADGEKALSCTLKNCKARPPALRALTNDCVENTVYEASCMLCRCDVVDGVKRESCVVRSRCGRERDEGRAGARADLSSLRGYCEPAHVYTRACNTCRCLSSGKVAACTARVCPRAAPPAAPVAVAVVPVRPRGRPVTCPRDHMYKVACNYCFCLRNGNLLCTTAKCD